MQYLRVAAFLSLAAAGLSASAAPQPAGTSVLPGTPGYDPGVAGYMAFMAVYPPNTDDETIASSKELLRSCDTVSAPHFPLPRSQKR